MKKIIFIVVVASLIMGCKQANNHDKMVRAMTTEDIEYVKKFPQQVELQKGEKVNLPIIGISNFRIIDSLLVVGKKETQNIWQFVTLNDLHTVGSMVNIGEGPNEFLIAPNTNSNSNFYLHNDSLYVDLFDNQKGKVLAVNILQSFKDKKLKVAQTYNAFSNNDFNVVRLSNGDYLVRTINDDATQLNRTVRNSTTGKETTTKVLNKLNGAKVNVGEDFNILGTIIKTTPDNVIYEAPISLNYLNIYSVDGTTSKTVCIGENLYDIDAIMETDRGERIKTFSDLKIFPKFFGVVYIGEQKKKYQQEQGRMPSIYLFTLDGKPLTEIKMQRRITSFDIDLQHGYLYTLDSQADEFLRYDIRNILKKISGQ